MLKIFLVAFHFYEKLDTITYIVFHSLGNINFKIFCRHFSDL